MLMIPIDTNSTIPLYEQIYTHIKNEIKKGMLTQYSKLPSTRNLAASLQVSRNTVDMAYAQLVAEGYLETKPKSGYYVSSMSNLMNLTTKEVRLSKKTKENMVKYKYDFSPFAIDITNFPYRIWQRLSKNSLIENNKELFLLGDNQGDESLRTAIARYLHDSRGVNCETEQILIGAGADYLLQLLSQLLKDNTTSIAMENPTYKQAYKIFKGMDYKIHPLPLDKDGIHITNLYKENANVVYVTPSHQYPLGIVMPINRRYELLQWANAKKNRYIIEDDHDSEFRYMGKPIPALQGIDSMEKVVYLGTFSRAIAPAIRVGYMVLPRTLLDIYKSRFNYYSSTVSRVDQAILTNFINDGYFERHINKMRKIYKNKHDILIDSLKIFENKIRIEGENAGLHLVLRFPESMDEETIIEIAEKNGIKLYGLREHYINQNSLLHSTGKIPPTILLGYANVHEEDLTHGIEELYHCLKKYFDII